MISSCVSDYQQRERARLKLEQEGLARRRAALAQMDREAQAGLRDAEVGGHVRVRVCVCMCSVFAFNFITLFSPFRLGRRGSGPRRSRWRARRRGDTRRSGCTRSACARPSASTRWPGRGGLRPW